MSPALVDFTALNTHAEASKSEAFEVRTGLNPVSTTSCGTPGRLFNPFFSYVKILHEVNYIVWIKQDESNCLIFNNVKLV